MVKIILASHGDLSKGMLNSVSMIVGELAKDIETYSLYPGENPNDYAASLKKRIEADTKDYVIVCDVKGGSVYNALLQTCNNERVLELVISNNSGNVNIDHVLDSGKVGITLENSVTLKKDIEEEEF